MVLVPARRDPPRAGSALPGRGPLHPAPAPQQPSGEGAAARSNPGAPSRGRSQREEQPHASGALKTPPPGGGAGRDPPPPRYPNHLSPPPSLPRCPLTSEKRLEWQSSRLAPFATQLAAAVMILGEPRRRSGACLRGRARRGWGSSGR